MSRRGREAGCARGAPLGHRTVLGLLLMCLLAAGTAMADALRLAMPEVLLRGDGLRLERQVWQLGEARGIAWRVRVPLPGRLRVASNGLVTPLPPLLPKDDGPWAAINGGFYYPDGRPMGLVVTDGQELQPLRRGGGSGVLYFDGAGPRIVHRRDYRPGARQALQSIDRLVADGRSLVNPQPGAREAARAALSISGQELWLVVAADERSIGGAGSSIRLRAASGYGLPLWAFAEYLVAATGAREALNLDGASSVQLHVRAGGDDFSIQGGRTINAVIVRPAKNGGTGP